MAAPPLLTHLLADFRGVPGAKLADAALVGGLAVAAASAAGLAAGTAPLVQARPGGGVTAALFCDGCHLLVHTLPGDGLLLLDVLVRSASHAAPDAPRAAERAAERAADVFARRLGVSPARTGAHARG